MPAKFKTIEEIAEANDNHGGSWFDPDTMDFFKSRVHDKVYGGRYFVTSERGPDGVRRYSVREAHGDGRVSTASKFQEFATSAQAHRAARKMGGAE